MKLKIISDTSTSQRLQQDFKCRYHNQTGIQIITDMLNQRVYPNLEELVPFAFMVELKATKSSTVFAFKKTKGTARLPLGVSVRGAKVLVEVVPNKKSGRVDFFTETKGISVGSFRNIQAQAFLDQDYTSTGYRFQRVKRDEMYPRRFLPISEFESKLFRSLSGNLERPVTFFD